MTTSDNYHAAALLIDASRDLAFISDILASSPEIITDHRWAVNIILNTAIKDVGKACTLIKEMPG